MKRTDRLELEVHRLFLRAKRAASTCFTRMPGKFEIYWGGTRVRG